MIPGRPPSGARIAVLSLGRFGSAVALELTQQGWDVLGIDADCRLVQHHTGQLTDVAAADTTDEAVLRRLGVPYAAHAVVGIGTDLESSMLTTLLLVNFGVPHIWAKAVSPRHATILQRIGAHHVVLPEQQPGERVAHLLTGRIPNFLEIDDDNTLAATRPPPEIIGQTLAHARLRDRHGVVVIGIKHPGERFAHATADTTIQPGDILIVAGTTSNVDAFANRR